MRFVGNTRNATYASSFQTGIVNSATIPNSRIRLAAVHSLVALQNVLMT